MLSVIFSTYNGEVTLPLMLEAFTKLTPNKNIKWELIAINNNSTDNTLDILNTYLKKLPLRILEEKKPGKNAALNKGIIDSSGNLLIFTDDDIIPDKHWLNHYDKLQYSLNEYSLFGGTIKPYWMSPPNEVLLENIPIGVVFAITPEDAQEGGITAGKIWGPNMAVRKNVFTEELMFNEDIGPNGKSYVMGSETDFLQRAEKMGHKAYFLPDSIVKHIIRPWQLEKTWLDGRAIRAGRGLVHELIRKNKLGEPPIMFGYPRWLVKKMAMLYINRQTSWITFNSAKNVRSSWDYFFNKGFALEFKNQKSKR
jgi:glycosyltransferase involved in cell wall biosynthesis